MFKRFIVLTICLSLYMFAFSQPSSNLSGSWYTVDQEAIVELTLQDDGYWGKVIWVNPMKPDYKEGQAFIGRTVIKHLNKSNKNQYANGEIYSVRKDQHFDIEGVLIEGELVLTVHWGWFTKDLIWTKVPKETLISLK